MESLELAAFSRAPESGQGHQHADKREQPAQHGREIRRPHDLCGTKVIAGRERPEKQPERDEHHA
jgi:hypothetical protein